MTTDPSQRIRFRLSLLRAIRHEAAEGIHSYSQCACKRMATRAGQCVLCLSEALAGLYNEPVLLPEQSAQ